MLTHAAIVWRLVAGKPIFVGFNVTNRCTMRCRFCSVPTLAHRDMSLEEVRHCLDLLKGIGVPVVGLTGGEPFLRLDLAGIVEEIERRGMKCTVVTNGDLFSRERAEELRGRRNIVHFALSLDSLDPGTYRRLRGNDRGSEILARFLGAVRHGPRTVYKLNVVVGPDNAGEVDGFLRLAAETGLGLSFIPVNAGPGGLHRGRCDRDLTPESRRRIAEVFRRLYRLKVEGKPLWDHRDFYLLAARYILGEGMGECRAGKLFLDLRSDGKLAFCNEMEHFTDLLARSRLRLADIAAARREWEPRIEQCRLHGACCYTCSYNVAATADNLAAYVWDYVRYKARGGIAKTYRGPSLPPREGGASDAEGGASGRSG